MPLYTFQCQACTHSFDKLVKIADSSTPQPCPVCTQVQATRQVSAPKVFDLRGGGYYESDFK